MWGYKSVEKKESKFFNGFNIIERMKNSMFGKVQKTFNEVFSYEETKTYHLPKIIVIGEESAGKSSLLENITKCKLFPRDKKLCTKCPIIIRLQNGKQNYSIEYKLKGKKQIYQIENKEDIYKIIDEYFNTFPDNFLSDDEIIVNISDINLPTFEFYDLPGIRAYPEKESEATKNLCRKYLQDKNSIILCVIPATDARLTINQTISIISEMGVEKNCILALTKCDKLQQDDVEDNLVKRILNTSDELSGLKLSNCVGIVNRPNFYSRTMEENDSFEKKWFDINIIKEMPQEYLNFKEEISKRLGVDNLIKNIDSIYNSFIQKDWKPKIINDINEKVVCLNEDYQKLGNIDINPIEINNYIHNMLRDEYEILQKNICQTIVNKEKNMDYELFCEDDDENKIIFTEYIFYILKEYTKNICNNYLEIDLDETNLFSNINNYFKIDKKYNLERFDKVKTDLKKIIRLNLENNIRKEKDNFIFQCNNYLINRYIGLKKDIIFNKEKKLIFKTITKLFKILILYPTLVFNVSYTKDDYEESEIYQNKRTEIIDNITKLNEHYALISSF